MSDDYAIEPMDPHSGDSVNNTFHIEGFRRS